MSIRQMFRRCANCGREFSYNPSVGRLGLICPYCKKPAGIGLPRR